jgi:hypothetical protein
MRLGVGVATLSSNGSLLTGDVLVGSARMASSGRTNLNTLAEGIQRYRAAGGKRAIATNISVDLSGPTEPCPDDGPFHLRCAPDEAARRLRRLRDLGFDDAVLVLKSGSEANLAAARAAEIARSGVRRPRWWWSAAA